MDEQKLEKLEETLYKAGACAVIEVTNGICDKRIRQKIGEVKDDKKFIEAVTYEGYHVTTGIFFFRQGALSDTNYKNIDVVCQIPEYEPEMAKEAFARTVPRAQSSDQKRVKILSIISSMYSLNSSSFSISSTIDGLHW